MIGWLGTTDGLLGLDFTESCCTVHIRNGSEVAIEVYHCFVFVSHRRDDRRCPFMVAVFAGGVAVCGLHRFGFVFRFISSCFVFCFKEVG